MVKIGAYWEGKFQAYAVVLEVPDEGFEYVLGVFRDLKTANELAETAARTLRTIANLSLEV